MENTIKEKIIRVAPTFSEEEMKALESARNREIVFDADCPETTPERAVKFRRVNATKPAVGK